MQQPGFFDFSGRQRKLPETRDFLERSSAAGRKLLSALIEAAGRSSTPEIAFLDFASIGVATSSFLRESVFGFRDYARAALPNVYPVVIRRQLTEGAVRASDRAHILAAIRA